MRSEELKIDITNKLEKIKILPENELEEIIQNVKTILTTTQGEVFLDRNFGVASELLDEPMAAVQAKITAKICEAVNKFENRARVTDVFFGGKKIDGELEITARIEVVEKNLRQKLR